MQVQKVVPSVRTRPPSGSSFPAQRNAAMGETSLADPVLLEKSDAARLARVNVSTAR
jgi:hypothetical protein